MSPVEVSECRMLSSSILASAVTASENLSFWSVTKESYSIVYRWGIWTRSAVLTCLMIKITWGAFQKCKLGGKGPWRGASYRESGRCKGPAQERGDTSGTPTMSEYSSVFPAVSVLVLVTTIGLKQTNKQTNERQQKQALLRWSIPCFMKCLSSATETANLHFIQLFGI